MVYIPEGGRLETPDMHLMVHHASTGVTEVLERNRDFVIIDNGLTRIGKKKYREYLVKMLTEEGKIYERTLDLYNDDRLFIDYSTSIPFGTNYILTRVFGYNYYEDKIIFEDVYTPVRREGRLEALEFTEEEWKTGAVEVGRPVKWFKRFRITNPNNVSVEEVFSTDVFPDVMTASLIVYEDGERCPLALKRDEHVYVNWIARLGGAETKTYVIEVATPPVMKVDENLDVLESGKILVKFMNNITLKNFAMHIYKNISFRYPVSLEKIISIGDSGLTAEEEENGTVIIVPELPPNGTVEISIVYKQKPPVLITVMDSLRYGCHDSANISIFIIPEEDEASAYLETEILGPDSRMKTAWIDLSYIGDMERFKEAGMSIGVDLGMFPGGRYLVVNRFKKNFGTVLSDEKEFFIDCPERQVIALNYLVFVVIAAAVIVMLLLRAVSYTHLTLPTKA